MEPHEQRTSFEFFTFANSFIDRQPLSMISPVATEAPVAPCSYLFIENEIHFQNTSESPPLQPRKHRNRLIFRVKCGVIENRSGAPGAPFKDPVPQKYRPHGSDGSGPRHSRPAVHPGTYIPVETTS